MGYVAANNAASVLAASITNGATTLSIQTTDIPKFPTINHGGAGEDYTYLTLQDSSNNVEIVKVTRHDTASASFTVVRGQDGTTARSWSLGDLVALRLNAGVVTDAFARTYAAQASEAAAAAYAAAAAASFDSFDDRFLGTKASEPTTDNDGNPLVEGALYFATHTTPKAMRFYDGASWQTIQVGITQSEADVRYLMLNAKAADSELLDGFNSTAFLRAVNGVGPDANGNVAVNVDLSSRVAKTGDTMSGHLNVPSLGINSAAPTLDLSDTTTGRTRKLHHNEDLMGFLKTDGNWDLYTNNNGQVWSANYGWLHDYFFSSVANCVRPITSKVTSGSPTAFQLGEENVINCYGGGPHYLINHELIDNGGQITHRGVRYYTNCNCNCQCNC